MGWFDEQLRKRYGKDQDLFEESLFTMASSILDKRDAGQISDGRIVTKEEIDEILKYFHCKPVDIPDSVTSTEEQMDYALRPYGLMYRKVNLTENWLKDACGPMLVFKQETGQPISIFPKMNRGYYYRDTSGSKQTVTKAEAATYQKSAYCFYKPLPLKKLSVKDLFTYIFECLSAGDIFFILMVTLIITMVGKLMPRFSSLMTGFIVQRGDTSLLWGTAIFMVITLVASELFSISRDLIMNRIESKASLFVEAAMMMRLMSLPVPFFRQYSSGELSSRSQAVNQLCSLLLGQVISIALTSIASLLYISDILKYAPQLVTPALLTILGTVAVMVVTSLTQMSVTKKAMEYQAKESGLSFSLITGVQKIKLAGAEKRVFAKWADVYAKSASCMYNPPFLLKVSGAITTLVSLVGTIAIYYFAVSTRSVTVSQYYAFNTSFGMVMGAFTSLAGIAVSASKIKPILDMAEPILKEVPETTDGKEILTDVGGGIELSHVSFRYNDSMPYVIDDLSLKIRSGEYLAIVGRTGCGKSTLVRLLLGFETPQRGSVYYDGKDLKGIDLRSLRKKIGTVTQDGSLFQGDIYSNIVISAPTLTLDDAWEAAETAGIAEDIRMMPMGMQTMIAEGQGGISGGQKQRLMIARAIAPKPKILIFDEATSALDNRTQKKVADALDKLNCTRIVIAHRLSTIRNCDRILVLDNGKVVEDGTYEELIEKGGYFAELVERQRLDKK